MTKINKDIGENLAAAAGLCASLLLGIIVIDGAQNMSGLSYPRLDRERLSRMNLSGASAQDPAVRGKAALVSAIKERRGKKFL